MSGFDDLLSDPRSVAEVIEAQLECDSRDDEGSEPSPIAILHARGTREVLEAALDLCASPEAKRRALGARVLGQLGSPRRTFSEECCDALLRLLADPDAGVRVASVFALGHLGNRRADAALIALRHDPDDVIRHGVAFALNGATSAEAVQALLELMEDSYYPARDWATAAVGGATEIDGPEIRSALLKRATDHDEMTRGEALLGLARRKDARAIPYLVAELGKTDLQTNYFLDAALEFTGLRRDEAPVTICGQYADIDDRALITLLLAMID